MRRALLIMSALSVTALADPPTGSWGGYVGGWSQNQSHSAWYVGNRSAFPVSNAQIRQAARGYQGTGQVWVSTPYWGAPAPEQQAPQAEQVAAQRYAAQQEFARREAEERLDAERRANDDYRARVAAADLAERERAAREAAAALAAQQVASLQASTQLAAQQKALDDAKEHAEARERAAQPYVKGPDVWHWVDSEGVTHYSTKPPRDARVRADKVDRQ